MDQVKKGSKTLLDYFFKRLQLKNVSQIKDYILLCPGQVRMTQARLHLPPKLANHIISLLTKNSRTTVPLRNDSSDQTK